MSSKFKQARSPKSIVASGGKLAYPNDASETPDTLQALYEYDKFNMLWEHATGIDNGPYNRGEGIAFIGNNGTLVVDRGGFEVMVEKQADGHSSQSDPKMDLIQSVKRPKDINYLDLHTQNFVKAVRENDASLLNTPIESGSIAAINAQMGNIAYKTGEKLHWDDANNKFSGVTEANALINAKYHNGWKKPV